MPFNLTPRVAEGASRVGRFLGRAILMLIALVFGLALLSGTVGTIDTGNVGVRTTLGVVNQEEIGPGLYFAMPVVSRVQEVSANEIAIDLNDLTPKARDNLSLRDMDITVYYRAAPSSIAELHTKYAGQSVAAQPGGYWLPAYELVFRVARNVAYEEVAKIDSLLMHTKRDELASAIQANMQGELERNDKGVFNISRVVIRAVATDPSIEKSIQDAVANQKKLEAMAVQTEIAKKEAQVRITEAQGIAEANRIISGSLTREYLQHESNQALLEFAKRGNTNTVVVPANMGAIAPLVNIPAPQRAGQ
jgi:regulator of protease activity HflC (stomatin/prohibitin superfamily)